MTYLSNLEPGIQKIVSEFIQDGRPSARKQTIHDRRQGYLNSISLAGEAEKVKNNGQK